MLTSGDSVPSYTRVTGEFLSIDNWHGEFLFRAEKDVLLNFYECKTPSGFQ